MLRRTTASSSTPSRVRSKSNRLNTSPSRSKSGGSRNSNSFLSPILVVLMVAALIFGLSWYLFPSETYQVEKKLEQEAQYVGHRVAQNAMNAEHKMEHWWQSRGSGSVDTSDNNNDNNSGMNAATARMMAQPSKWVDGEKALKKQLKELQAIQEKGELLGVPVLTRYLGEDFPAWVGKDMNEEVWKQKVADKYKEMREEEEEWRKEMQKIIDPKQDLV